MYYRVHTVYQNDQPESAEIRANRLLLRRERERALRASETAKQKEERLRKRRMRDRAKRATKTSEERAAALQQIRERQTSETEKQRETRLQRMRANKSGRMAAETKEQREARLQHDRERHRKQHHPQLSLFEQPSVQAKCINFIHSSVHWICQYVLPVPRDFLASNFIHACASIIRVNYTVTSSSP